MVLTGVPTDLNENQNCGFSLDASSAVYIDLRILVISHSRQGLKCHLFCDMAVRGGMPVAVGRQAEHSRGMPVAHAAMTCGVL